MLKFVICMHIYILHGIYCYIAMLHKCGRGLKIRYCLKNDILVHP